MGVMVTESKLQGGLTARQATPKCRQETKKGGGGYTTHTPECPDIQCGRKAQASSPFMRYLFTRAGDGLYTRTAQKVSKTANSKAGPIRTKRVRRQA